MTSILELYLRGKSLLKDFLHPPLEARILLMHAAGITEEQFFASPERKVSRPEERRFFQLIAKRLAGFPLACVIGWKEFWSIPFRILQGVAIPRPETELIVEKVLKLSSRKKEIIVDLGTGCGNIAIALAKELPLARIIATDISRKALNAARLNASEQNVRNVTFILGNLLSPLKKLGLMGKCDFIVSNPPYVSEEEWDGLPAEIKNHEPKKALVAGGTGLEVIEKIILCAPSFLKPGAFLVLEIGAGQRDKVLFLFDSQWSNVESANDLRGIPRVIVSEKPVKKNGTLPFYVGRNLLESSMKPTRNG